MSKGLWYKYCEELHNLGDGTDTTSFMHASSEQRTKVFLKIIGKYKE